MLGHAVAVKVILNQSARSDSHSGNPENPGFTEPGPIRRWLKQWSDRRILKATRIRLALTAPHLLDDAGLDDTPFAPVGRPQYTPPVETHDDKEPQFAIAMAAE